MSSSMIGRRYARALYELGEEQKQTDAVRGGLESLLEAWESSKDLRDVFQNPAVDGELRKNVLGAIAKRLGLPALLETTLYLLSDRGRLRYVPEVAEAYFELLEELGGRVRAEVTTASQLPEVYFFELQETLERATGKKVTLVKKEDPDLIGGVVTRVGDMVFDGSLRTRLHDLEATLLAADA